MEAFTFLKRQGAFFRPSPVAAANPATAPRRTKRMVVMRRKKRVMTRKRRVVTRQRRIAVKKEGSCCNPGCLRTCQILSKWRKMCLTTWMCQVCSVSSERTHPGSKKSLELLYVCKESITCSCTPTLYYLFITLVSLVTKCFMSITHWFHRLACTGSWCLSPLLVVRYRLVLKRDRPRNRKGWDLCWARWAQHCTHDKHRTSRFGERKNNTLFWSSSSFPSRLSKPRALLCVSVAVKSTSVRASFNMKET